MDTKRIIMLTLSHGVKTTFTADNLVWSMLPHGKRGDAAKFIKMSVVELHQSQFSHMRLTFGMYLADLQEKFQVSQSKVIAVAIAWHVGKHARTD